MKPRIGPQNITMDDLRRVTGKITRLQPGGPRPLPSQQIVSNLVGGPLPTYGKKYGGFTTQEQLTNAIIGQTQALAEAQALAEEEAAINRANLYGQRQFQPRTPQDYDRVRFEQQALSEALRQRIQPQAIRPDVTLSRAADLAETEARLADLYMQPKYQQNRRARMDAQEAIRLLRREVPGELQGMNADVARDLAMRKATEDARADAYARNMERMNAIALREPSPETFDQVGGRAVSMADIAAQRLGTPVTVEQAAAQTAAEQSAIDLANTSRAQFAQQLATSRYGMDPGLAAGLFGPEFGAEQRLREASTEFTQPGQSVEDYIALNMGTAALEQFQANKVQEALKKQEESFRTADEEALDLELERSTGVNVSAAAGDYSLSTARGYLSNPSFIEQINAGMQAVASAKGTSVEDKRNAARMYAMEYFNQVGDPVAAQILFNALTSFEFSLGFMPAGS